MELVEPVEDDVELFRRSVLDDEKAPIRRDIVVIGEKRIAAVERHFMQPFGCGSSKIRFARNLDREELPSVAIVKLSPVLRPCGSIAAVGGHEMGLAIRIDSHVDFGAPGLVRHVSEQPTVGRECGLVLVGTCHQNRKRFFTEREHPKIDSGLGVLLLKGDEGAI